MTWRSVGNVLVARKSPDWLRKVWMEDIALLWFGPRSSVVVLVQPPGVYKGHGVKLKKYMQYLCLCTNKKKNLSKIPLDKRRIKRDPLSTR